MLRAVGSGSWATLRNKPSAYSNGVKLAVFGDSITGFNNRVTYSAGTLSTLKDEAEGIVSWLQVFSKFAFDYTLNVDSIDWANTTFSTTTGANFGVSGDDTGEALLRVGDVIAYRPDVCIVRLGTNDALSSTVSYDTSVSNMHSILRSLTDAGIFVILLPVPPISSWGALSAPQIVTSRNFQNRFNDWLMKYNKTYSNSMVFPVDSRSALIDPTSATGDPASGMLRDGVHYSPLAGRAEAAAIWSAIQYMIPPHAGRWAFSQADTYHSTENPTGNLMTNGLLTGTGGSKGTDITGSLADSMSASRSGTAGTITAVASKGATGLDGNAGTYQRFVVTANGTGDNDDSITMTQTTAITTNFSTGDVIEAGCLAAMSSVTGKLREFGISLEITDSVAGTYSIEFLDQFDNTYLLPNTSFSGAFKTQPFRILSTCTSINLRTVMRFNNTSAGGGTFDVGNMFIRKVV